MKKALIILAQSGYQDHEFAGTRDALQNTNFDIIIASKDTGPCTGKFDGTEAATVAMRDVSVSDYDRIAFIGGPGAAAYANDGDALNIASSAARAGIPLGAICIAPTILAKAHVLKGKRATVWDSAGEQAALLETYGAKYTGEAVTVDGSIVTGNGPEAAEEFGRVFVGL